MHCDFSERRYSRLRRILDVLRIVIKTRRATASEVNHALKESVGVNVCWRTTLRDLRFLENQGFVQCERVPSPRPSQPELFFVFEPDSILLDPAAEFLSA